MLLLFFHDEPLLDFRRIFENFTEHLNIACLFTNIFQDESYFAYDNAFDACYTTGRLLWLKVKYIQTGNTETDKRDELFTEFTAWVEEQTFSPYELMQEASCLTDCECCVLDSCLKAPSTIMSRLKCSSYDSDRRKRRSTDDDVLAMAFDACKFKLVSSADDLHPIKLFWSISTDVRLFAIRYTNHSSCKAIRGFINTHSLSRRNRKCEPSYQI